MYLNDDIGRNDKEGGVEIGENFRAGYFPGSFDVKHGDIVRFGKIKGESTGLGVAARKKEKKKEQGNRFFNFDFQWARGKKKKKKRRRNNKIEIRVVDLEERVIVQIGVEHRHFFDTSRKDAKANDEGRTNSPLQLTRIRTDEGRT